MQDITSFHVHTFTELKFKLATIFNLHRLSEMNFDHDHRIDRDRDACKIWRWKQIIQLQLATAMDLTLNYSNSIHVHAIKKKLFCSDVSPLCTA